MACTLQVLRHAYAQYESFGCDEIDPPYPYPPGYMDAWKSSRVWFVRELSRLACGVTSNRFVDAAMLTPRCERCGHWAPILTEAGEAVMSDALAGSANATQIAKFAWQRRTA